VDWAQNEKSAMMQVIVLAYFIPSCESQPKGGYNLSIQHFLSFEEFTAMRNWENPQVVAVNKVSGHVPAVPFHTSAAALTASKSESPFYQCLNGEWHFAYGEDADAMLAAAADGSISAWENIQVPGNWTLQGYDKPHYVNVQMPFYEQPPNVPAVNPTGVYQRTFSLPVEWDDREIFLCFDGVESAFAGGREHPHRCGAALV
jgi:beta-galactosidase